MVERIIWTKKAKTDLKEIFSYWKKRNKSNIFNIKLHSLIEAQLNLIFAFPEIGKNTDIPNVQVCIVQNYLLYYEIKINTLYILTIRHSSRNQDNIQLKS